MAEESLHGDRLLPVGSELGPVVGHLLTVVQQTSELKQNKDVGSITCIKFYSLCLNVPFQTKATFVQFSSEYL